LSGPLPEDGYSPSLAQCERLGYKAPGVPIPPESDPRAGEAVSAADMRAMTRRAAASRPREPIASSQ